MAPHPENCQLQVGYKLSTRTAPAVKGIKFALSKKKKKNRHRGRQQSSGLRERPGHTSSSWTQQEPSVWNIHFDLLSCQIGTWQTPGTWQQTPGCGASALKALAFSADSRWRRTFQFASTFLTRQWFGKLHTELGGSTVSKPFKL